MRFRKSLCEKIKLKQLQTLINESRLELASEKVTALKYPLLGKRIFICVSLLSLKTFSWLDYKIIYSQVSILTPVLDKKKKTQKVYC